ncbi:MAG: hypothetical protein E7449_05505 [Ruminococcaceae bacterium]|nr:hypothetical protein [Oscillospiraceae bacterium]
MNNRKPKFPIYLLILLILVGCSTTPNPSTSHNVAETPSEIGPGVFPDHDVIAEARANSAASYIFDCNDVTDLVTVDWFDTVIVVEFLTPGEYETIVEGNIFVDYRGDQRIEADLRTCAAETQATVLEVIKGNTSLVGTTITVGERMYKVDAGKWISRYLSDETMTRALICAHYDNSYAYVCTTPEWQIIKLNDDDTLEIWPFLENVENYQTLSAFRTMAQQELSEQSSMYSTNSTIPNTTGTPLTQEQILVFTEMLNDPENNGLLRSEYETFPNIDLDEVLILTNLPTDDVTAEERSAYADQTGQTVDHLLKISNAELSAYLQEKFGAAPEIFESFTWVYLESSDAWYHTPYTTQPLEIAVFGGTVTNERHLIRYAIFKDGRAISGGTLIYNDFGNLSWFESNQYQ